MAETQARRVKITFKDTVYTVNAPTEGQILALSFATSGGDSLRAEILSTVGQVVHACVGDKLWGEFMRGLVTGTYTGSDFVALVEALMKAVTTPEDKPVNVSELPSTFKGNA